MLAEAEDLEELEERVLLDAMAPSNRLSTCDTSLLKACNIEISGPLGAPSNDVNSNEVILTECFANEISAPEQIKKFRLAEDSSSNSSMRRIMYEIRVDRITENILTLVFPGSGDSDDYSWSLRDVSKKLRIKYGSRYKILNLSERRKDLSSLNENVIDYGWPEDLAPPIRFLRAMCHEIRNWLTTNKDNVIVFHCKGGTGRLATLIAAYMYFCMTRGRIDQSVLSDKSALKQYYEDKLNTFCLPSQRRYVQYFSELLSGSLNLADVTVHLHSLALNGLPRLESSLTGCYHLKFYQNMRLLTLSPILMVADSMERLVFVFHPPLALNGDILIKCFYQRDPSSNRETIFWLQFHTCALRSEQLNLYKQELDAACLDFRYPANARVELFFKPSATLQDDYSKALHSGGVKVCASNDKTPSFVHCDSYEDLSLTSVVNSPLHKTADIDSASQIHGPMDQQQATRLSAVTHTGGPIEGKLQEHVTRMNEETTEERYIKVGAPPTSAAATIMAASSDANELDRLLEELKVVGDVGVSSANHSASSNTAYRNVTTHHVTPSSQPQTSYSTTITRTHNGPAQVRVGPAPASGNEQVLIDQLRSAQDRLLTLRQGHFTDGGGGGGYRESESGPGFRYEKEVQRGPGWENVQVVREEHHSSGGEVATRMAPRRAAPEQEAFDISLRYSSMPASKSHKGHTGLWDSVEQQHEALMPAHSIRHRSSSSDRFAQAPAQSNAQTSHWSHESRTHSTSGMRAAPAGRSVSVEANRFPMEEADFAQHHHHQQHQAPAPAFRSHSQEHFIAETQVPPYHRYDVETVEVHRDEPLANSYSAHRENQRLQSQQQQQQQQQQQEYQRSLQRSYQQSSRVSEVAPEVVEEVETVTLQPIGKGVQDLDPNRPVTPGVPPAPLAPRTPTLSRAAELQHQSSRSFQHSVQQTSHSDQWHGTNMAARSPGPVMDGAVFESASATGTGGHSAPKFVKDTSCFWYKPKISREEAISLLRDKAPGLFVVRDSNSYPGAFGLAVKVAQLPPGVTPRSDFSSPHFQDDLQAELVRHFLIEPSSKGVRLKGCANEPVFGSLAALVYQHTLTPLALPCRLVVPEQDLAATAPGVGDLLKQGAACNVLYMGSVDVESMTGTNAVSRAVDVVIGQMNAGRQTTDAHFKASAEGITLTDNHRKLFFRRHYALNLVSFCGLDPKDRVWDSPELRARNIQESRIFGVVTRRQGSNADNVCHVFSELEASQPATAVVRFVNRHLLNASDH